MSKEVILTGLRSNSDLHLGNYLGAILPMVELQKKHAGKYQLNMFVPDLHSFITPLDHGSLYSQSLNNLRIYIAAGLDIDQPDTYIYRQSYIPAHSEMAWILDCFTYFGELSRMTQFKDKSADQVNVSVGLFNYPVLMAADILLYGARWVPVGEDQRQHLEFARDVAIRMNHKFGELFVVPEDNSKQAEFVDRSEPIRIRSLRSPDKKMSKSIDDPAGTIMLNDKPGDAAKKIMSATTDSLGSINFNYDKQPGISNLLQILSLISAKPQAEINGQWQGNSNYGELKSFVAKSVEEFIGDLQAKLSKVNKEQLFKKLEVDEVAMGQKANQVLVKVQTAVGLRPSNLKT